jgi:DNA-directed RNA polymerase subunit L
MISISAIEKLDNDTIKFDIDGCNTSFVNAIRRTILSEVETVSFNIDDYENSDLKVLKNTSSLHNEFLLHRLGLIPVNIEDVDNFNPDNYKFVLKKQNNTNKLINVTTNDFKVTNLESSVEEDVLTFFPPNEITKDNILIITLKNNPTGDGEEVHIEGKCSKGSGKENSRFSPVSNVVFINKCDKVKSQAVFEEHISKLDETPSPDELKKLAKRFDIEESNRYFYVDENGDPNRFEFTIESIGVIPPDQIFKRAVKLLVHKINKFNRNLDLALDSKESLVSIRESGGVMNGFDITIKDENHTLGFLLQTYINKLNEGVFVGYMNPHPLQKEIKIRVNFNDNDINTVKSVFEKTTAYLIGELNRLSTSPGF